MRLILVVCGVIASVMAFAEPTFQLQLPAKSGYAYWVGETGSTTEPKPVQAKSAQVEVMVAGDPNGQSVYVVDESKGLVASTTAVEAIKAKSWKPDAKSFDRVLVFVVETDPDKGTLTSGSVTIKAGGDERRELLDETSHGKATFYLLPNQKLSVTVDYKVDGKTESARADGVSPTSGFVQVDIPASFKDDTPSPHGSAESGSASPKAPGKDSGVSPVFTFIRLLVGLAVVGGLGYLAYWYYKNHQKVVDGVLTQAGLDPNATVPDPTGAMPPDPVQRELKKIDLGAGAAVAAGAVSQPDPGGPAVKNPRLVTEAGDICLLTEGEASVGREAGAVVAADPSVSRNHAVLVRSGDSVTVNDSGSTNGTFVNGQKISAPVQLRVGDTVQFGSVRYRYEE